MCSPVVIEGWDMVFADYFICLLLRNVILRYIDTVSIGPVVAAEQIV